MKYINIFIGLTICFYSFIGIENATAQVVIGSGEQPIKAAVLDIKGQLPDSDNVTSTQGGIVMPRLKLKNINTLEPFIANDDSDIVQLKRLHVGLMIYNLTKNADLVEGLYVWNGAKWEAVLTATGEGESITVENGLSTSPSGDYLKLGGTLDANTNINQSNFPMNFRTTAGSLSVNDTDFIVVDGNTGVGKVPSLGNKLDVNEDIQMNGNLTISGQSVLENTQIEGALVYAPDGNRKIGKYLRADKDGKASWRTVSGLSNPDMEFFPANKLIFNPRTASTTDYLNTGIAVSLGSGKWLINYSIRVVAPVITTPSVASIRPSTFRFTMLDDEGVPSPSTGKKPYDDSRLYPDVYYNACMGFMVVENNTLSDKIYYLGVRPQEVPTWPNGDVEIANNSTQDGSIVAIFLEESQ